MASGDLTKRGFLFFIESGKKRLTYHLPYHYWMHHLTQTEVDCYRGVARILGKGVHARSVRANSSNAHLQNGKVEVQIITENAF